MLSHCQKKNLIRLDFTGFKRAPRGLFMEQFQVELRHDMRTPRGHPRGTRLVAGSTCVS